MAVLSEPLPKLEIAMPAIVSLKIVHIGARFVAAKFSQ
jgi:hypothetical protein